MKRKFKNIFDFFARSVYVTFVCSAASYLFGGLSVAVAIALTVGFAASVFVHQYRHAAQYVFYFNNGLTKMQLWIGCYLLTFVFTQVIASTIVVIKIL